MNPSDRQRPREEVFRLHSLWHQGRPRKPNPIPKPENPSIATLQTPANTTSFKKQNSTTKKKKKKKCWKQRAANNSSESEPVRDSGPEWPVIRTPSTAASAGWPEVKLQTPVGRVSAKEQASLLAMQVQNKGLQSCREFFSERVEEESDEDGEDEELGEVDYLTENDRLVDDEVYRFLLQMFINDDRLRCYYEKNYESGEFCCLVCVGTGEKVNKRYKDCVGLVQHSIAISKTKRTRAHRAFGQVVCKVLGWDVDRLPVIVLKGEPLGKSLPISGGFQADDVHNCLEDPNSKHMSPEVKDMAVECQGSGQSFVATGWSSIKPVNKNSLIVSGWPTWKPLRPLVISLASAQEQTQLGAVQFQQKVLEACRQFFEKSTSSSSDESSDEDEDDLMDENGPEDSEEFKFFLKLFTENNELRSYYEKNYEGGKFYCLVCGGIGKKIWKRFKDCLGLLQHSTTILNTKKKTAHRAFGQVICMVLGWDIDRLPTIVLKGEPLGHCLAKLGVSQVEADRNADGNKDDLSAPINNAGCVSARKQNSDFRPNKRASIASEGSPNEYDATKHGNNGHDGNLYVEGCKEVETDTWVR